MKAFKRYIFNAFSKYENYDEVEYQILKCHDIFMKSKSLLFYKRLSQKLQYELCCKTCLIVVHSIREHLNDNPVLTMPEKEEFAFSIYTRKNVKTNKQTLLINTKHLKRH